MASDEVSLSKLPGPLQTKIIEENIDTVRNLIKEKPNLSIFEVSTAMKMSMCTVWKIFRTTLRNFLYKPKTVHLTNQHKLCKVQFCKLDFASGRTWNLGRRDVTRGHRSI